MAALGRENVDDCKRQDGMCRQARARACVCVCVCACVRVRYSGWVTLGMARAISKCAPILTQVGSVLPPGSGIWGDSRAGFPCLPLSPTGQRALA